MTEELAVEVDVKNPDRGAGVVYLIYFVRMVLSLRLIANSHIVESDLSHPFAIESSFSLLTTHR